MMILYRILYRRTAEAPWVVYRSRLNARTGIYDSYESVQRVLAQGRHAGLHGEHIRIETTEVTWREA